MNIPTFFLAAWIAAVSTTTVTASQQTQSCGQCFANANAIEQIATAVYFEARSEPKEGQIAVAYVIMNRVQSGKFPSTVQEVIAQDGQFSYTQDGSPDVITDKEAHQVAREAATLAFYKKVSDPTLGAMFYKNDKLSKQKWHMVATRKIGKHTFYSNKV